MRRQILIVAGEVQLQAELNDSPTATAIYEALPIVGSGNRWGEEIYFDIPVDEPLSSDAIEEVEIGALGYWPPGKAFCIFFGPTPASIGEEPRAASPVNIIGNVVDDVGPLTEVAQGAGVQIVSA